MNISTDTQNIIQTLISEANAILLGKAQPVLLALTAFLAKGHLLIEDVPGVGKTTMAVGLARLLGLDFVRIQMTSDLLPGDLIGVSLFDPKEQMFRFHKGPLFHSLVLADEINRASPRTQSALLEAMAEGQVSVDGITYELTKPFFVLATQNPKEESGVFPLPDSQKDRFIMKIEIGYPSLEAQKGLLTGGHQRSINPVLTREQIITLQDTCKNIYLSDEIVEMILAITEHSKDTKDIRLGLSPRGMLALKFCAQAWAFLSGRDFVVPDDLKAVVMSVISHRIQPAIGLKAEAVCRKLIQETWG